MTEHELKTWPEHFMLVAIGLKTFEIRLDDRNFNVNDVLHLKEYDPDTEEYTGRSVKVRVTHLMDNDYGSLGHDLKGLVPGYVIMSIKIQAFP
jgi:hypothetical protein